MTVESIVGCGYVGLKVKLLPSVQGRGTHTHAHTHTHARTHARTRTRTCHAHTRAHTCNVMEAMAILYTGSSWISMDANLYLTVTAYIGQGIH